MRTLGVPYTDDDIAGATAAVEGKTELDALVAYLQNLGTAHFIRGGKQHGYQYTARHL